MTNTQLFEIKVTTVQNQFYCISSNDWVFLKVELLKLYVMKISLFCPILEYYHPQEFNLADSYIPLNAEVSTKLF
jgi:hypothetical protein